MFFTSTHIKNPLYTVIRNNAFIYNKVILHLPTYSFWCSSFPPAKLGFHLVLFLFNMNTCFGISFSEVLLEMNSLLLCLSKMFLFCFHFWRIFSLAYNSRFWKLILNFFCLQHFKDEFPLSYSPSVPTKSPVTCIVSIQYIKYLFFFLAAFKIFFIYLRFSSEFDLVIFRFGFCCIYPVWAFSWICRLMSSINFGTITKTVYLGGLILFLLLGHKYVSDNLIWPHRSYGPAPPFIFFLFEFELLLLTCFLFIVSNFLLNILNECFISDIFTFSFVRFLFVFFS